MRNSFNSAFDDTVARWRLYLVIPAFLAFLCFSPALWAGFVWDDNSVWAEQVPKINSLSQAFFPPAEIPNFSYVYYRPLVVASYFVESKIQGPATIGKGKLDPAKARLPHAVTIGMHAIASALVGLLAYGLLKRQQNAALGALAAGSLFAALPVHAESAAFIAGRSDVMACAFLLGGLIFIKNWLDDGGIAKLFAFGSLFLCALLSKETALAAVLLMPLALIDRDWRAKAPKFLAAAITPLAAYFVMRTLAGLDASPGMMFGAGEALSRMLGGLWFYLQNLVWPWPVTPFVPDMPPPWLGVVALSVFCGALALAVRSKLWGVALGLGWVLVFLLPPLGVLAVSKQLLAERYLYIPSVGLCLAAGALFCEVEHKLKGVMTAALVAIMGASSFAAAQNWKSDVIFWTSVASQAAASQHPTPWMNLGTAQLKEGNLEAAVEAYNSALKAASSALDMAKIHQSLAAAHIALGERAGQTPQALGHFARAVESAASAVAFAPNEWRTLNAHAHAQIMLYQTQLELGRQGDTNLVENARRELEISARLDPTVMDTKILMGMIR